LAFYGPISEALRREWPQGVDWWAEYARIAVQVFLVMSGFLVARSLPGLDILSARAALARVLRRYLRLFVPFMVAAMAASLASIPARAWFGSADWVSQPLDAWTLLAHLTGLFDYLDIEALTAGAWYVSIDFQLHVLVILSLWLCQARAPDRATALRWWWTGVFGLALIAWVWLGRRPEWDITPFYFFGSFALGLSAGCLCAPARAGASPTANAPASFEHRIALAMLFVGGACWLVQPAVRPAVAWVSAVVILGLALGAGERFDRSLQRGPVGRASARLIGVLGQSAYSLFLVHVPFSILINALYQHYFPGDFDAAVIAALVAWLGALPLAWLMYRFLEQPIERRWAATGSGSGKTPSR
jgi:peptidoglycan/LPS O-acetylase OafA/YrhL